MSLEDLTSAKALGTAIPFSGEHSDWPTWHSEVLGRIDAFDACALISKPKDVAVADIVASLDETDERGPDPEEIKEFISDGNFRDDSEVAKFRGASNEAASPSHETHRDMVGILPTTETQADR
jgi:hypothetical protein